jgi:hypothetical protein
LPLTLLAVAMLAYCQSTAVLVRSRLLHSMGNSLLSLIGYLLVMSPWMLRNLSVFGTFMPPGSGYLLWMTDYNQIFSLTPEIYTFQSLIANGLLEVIKVRGLALLENIGTAIFAQGMIVLFPLVLIGISGYWRMARVKLGVLGWFVLIIVESFLFPYPSVRGGFFHAGAAFQPLWFALAPLGLETLFTSFLKIKKLRLKTVTLFQFSLAVVVMIFSVMLVKMRVIDTGWNEGEYLYKNVDHVLVEQGAQPQDIVMTRNPPAYFIMTTRQAIIVPYGNIQTAIDAARKYNVSYFILEREGAFGDLADLYDQPENYPSFDYLGKIDETIILRFNSSR